MSRVPLKWSSLTEGLVIFARALAAETGVCPATIITLGSDRSLPAAVYLRNILDALYDVTWERPTTPVFNLKVNDAGAIQWPEGRIVVPVLFFDLDCEYTSVEDLEAARDGMTGIVLPTPDVLGLGESLVQIGVAFPTKFQERTECSKSFIHTGPSRPEQVEYEYPWENPSA